MTEKLMKGKVWKYGDNINTDIISPPAYMEMSIEEASKYAMSPIDDRFAKDFMKGDILVGENNFGSGSSRETAPLTLKHIGVTVIIAKSFARIFYRNAINTGVLPLVCESADEIEDGSEVSVNLKEAYIEAGDKRYRLDPIPEFMMKIVEGGGLVEYAKRQ